MDYFVITINLLFSEIYIVDNINIYAWHHDECVCQVELFKRIGIGG